MEDPANIPRLFEDEELVVVDKPAGRLVVPAPGRRGPTVVDLVTRAIGGPVRAVHRLDEDTTGVLVLARTERAARALEGQFRRHDCERTYRALVTRMPSPPAGRLRSWLRERPDGIVESRARGPGLEAVTDYTALRRVGRYTLVECRPATGRRNQIRVHLAELGCPIVGDRKYGFRGANPFGRVVLHALRIRFRHPRTGEMVEVEAAPREPELGDASGLQG